jgi:hypothetical protein
MPLKIPTSTDIDTQGRSFVRAEISELSAIARKGSFVSGMVTAFFLSVHGLYRAFKRFADFEPWPQTASEGFFEIGWWLDITGLNRNQPSAAQGYCVITGTSGSIIASGATLTSGGKSYTTDSAATVATQALAGTSSGPSQYLGRFMTASSHNLASGMTLTFSGCVDASLNGSFVIRVVDATTIEYDLTTPLTGVPVEPNPVAVGAWGNVRITATETGPNSNLTSGAAVTISSPADGLDADALVTFDGLADGSALESLESWRARVLQGLATDFGTFSADEIRIVAKTVPGVTRVFVRKPVRWTDWQDESQVQNGVIVSTGYPIEGRTRIAFLRDDDADPIPSAAEVEQVRAKIHSDLLPAHVLPEDCEVLAPERYSLQVRFISISPDTPGMRKSIRNHLLEFLVAKASWGGVLQIDDIRCAIREAYDEDTGQGLERYELDTPTLDIALPVDAYPVLASIQWSI